MALFFIVQPTATFQIKPHLLASTAGWIYCRKIKSRDRTIYWSDREGFNWFVTGQKTEKQLANIFNLVCHQS
jgi:hypothetical protein